MADPIYKYSVNEYPTDGTQVTYEISFADGYIDPSYVAVKLTDSAGVTSYPTFTVNQDFTLTLDTVPAAGGTLMIYRDTPADKPLVDFQDGAVINEATLDLNARQAVHLAAETRDIVGSIPQLEALQSAEAALRYATSRANHTGTQAISTVDGLQPALDGLTSSIATFNTPAGSGFVGYQRGATATYSVRTVQAKMSEGRYSVLDFAGVVRNSTTTDSTVGFQAAEDATTQLTISGSVGTSELFIPVGRYNVGVITRKSYSWKGEGPNNTVLYYSGAADGVMVTQDATTVGRNSTSLISGITLRDLNHTSACLLSIPQNPQGYGVDDRYVVEHTLFDGSKKHISIDAWVNVHWHHLRFDNYQDCAIELLPKAGQNQSSFNLTDFTTDNAVGQTTNAPDSLVRVDLQYHSVDATSFIGPVRLANARIEMNQSAFSGNKSVIHTKATGGRQVEYVLDTLTIQNTVASGVDALFSRDQGGTLSSERYSLRNVQTSGITAMFKGDFPTWMLSIPTGHWMFLYGSSLTGFVGMRTVSSGGTGLEYFSASSNSIVQQVSVPGEAFARRVDRPDVLLSGTGDVAAAVLLRMAGKTGWTIPTGTLSRGAVPAYTAGTASASYDTTTQSLISGLSTQVQGLTRIVAALITDLHVSGSGSHGLLRP